MRSIVRIALPPVVSQFLSSIATPLESEYSQVFDANVAVEQLVLPPHVILELLERFKRPFPFPLPADVATVFQYFVISLLDIGSAKEEAELAILQIGPFEFGEEDSKRFDGFRKDNLKNLITVRL